MRPARAVRALPRPRAVASEAHLTVRASSARLAPLRCQEPGAAGSQECIGPLCYNFSRLDDYLAQPSVRAALGVGDRSWQSCSPEVYQDMSSAAQHGARAPTPAAASADSPEAWAARR